MEDKTKAIIELYESGLSLVEIARRFGVTPPAINYTLKKYGKKKENFNYSPKITDELGHKILSLGADHTVTEIAKETGISTKRKKK